MKKLLVFLCALTIIACKEKEEKKEIAEVKKDYVTFTGKIFNKSTDSIQIGNRTFRKTINVNNDGTFSDTLKVEPGLYSFYDGNESTMVYLKNGYDLEMTLDTKEFDESIKFSGEGAVNNNFLAEKALYEEQAFKQLDDVTEENIDSAFEELKADLSQFYASKKDIDTVIINGLNRDLDPMLTSYKSYYNDKIALKKEFPKGKASPSFQYENYKGGKTSLEDLKGKYVYVDVWATWCGPCKAEIPSLKKVENQYHDKKIEFVSISIDQQKDHEKWKAMVAEKELGGVQLFADNAWESKFVTDYKIKGIPRFILIDPQGKIVSADAPRPSDPKLIELFNELKI